MRHLFTFLLLLISISYAVEANATTTVPIVIQMEKQNNEPDKDVIPSKGHRCPSMSFYCIIDLSNLSMETNVTDEILCFEIWIENGECIIDSFDSAEDTARYLAAIEESYQLRLITQEYTYIGYVKI